MWSSVEMRCCARQKPLADRQTDRQTDHEKVQRNATKSLNSSDDARTAILDLFYYCRFEYSGTLQNFNDEIALYNYI